MFPFLPNGKLPFVQESLQESNSQQALERVTGPAELVYPDVISSAATGIAPAGHLFGTFRNQTTRYDQAFSSDGSTLRVIPPVEGYRQFFGHAASNDGWVVGSCSSPLQNGVSAFVPCVFEHQQGTTSRVVDAYGEARGISADGLRVVGTRRFGKSGLRFCLWCRDDTGHWNEVPLHGPKGEDARGANICISPDGRTIAGLASLGLQKHRTVTWTESAPGKWRCREWEEASRIEFAVYRINNAGRLCGTFTRQSGINVAAVTDHEEGIVELGGHAPGAHSFGRGINSSGTALVYSYDRENSIGLLHDERGLRQIAFNNLAAGNITVFGLSDAGAVAGELEWPIDDDGGEDESTTRAFLWNPAAD